MRYVLERYESGSGNRYVCPACGRRRCFTRYVDQETGEYVDEECGKCDHAASCGYHYPPREYFRDHPGRSLRTDSVNGKPLLGLSSRSSVGYRPRQGLASAGGVHGRLPGDGFRGGQEMHQTEFFDRAWVEKSMLRTSTFRQWLELLATEGDGNPLASLDVIRQVLADYLVGGTAKDIFVGGTNYGPAVVFWQIDELGRVHDAKLMAYRRDGHRVSGWANSMRSICERSHVGPQLAETEKVLFGLHLLPRCPEKTVCIVESEKTAIVCACHYPQFLWLATGGCGNLQPGKLQPLLGRNVVVYPDSGEYEKWKECMAGSGVAHCKVVDFMEQYDPNTDIADVLLGEARQKHEIFLPPPTAECPF